MNELREIENELVPVYMTSTGEKVVYGTELYEVLEVKSPYREWSARRLKDCEAVECEDYASVEISTLAGGTPKKEHIIKLDTAKEMAMLERNEKGKQVRRYFIGVEKKYKGSTTTEIPTGRQLMALAVLEAQKTIAEQNQVMEQMKPKAEYFDALVDRNLLTSFRDTAKEFGVKERRFIDFLIEKKYIYRDQGGKLRPFADKNNGLFELKEFNYNGHPGVQTLITPKGRETFRLLIKKYKEDTEK